MEKFIRRGVLFVLWIALVYTIAPLTYMILGDDDPTLSLTDENQAESYIISTWEDGSFILYEPTNSQNGTISYMTDAGGSEGDYGGAIVEWSHEIKHENGQESQASWPQVLRSDDGFVLCEGTQWVLLNSESGIEIEDDASLELARRARGTPRIGNRLLKRCRDFADMETSGVINLTLVEDSLNKMRIDLEGLDQMDRIILESIIEKFNGGPVGLNTLAAAVSEEKDTIEDVYEPFLLLKGFIQRTPRGRVVTENAYKHLGLSKKHHLQDNLI